MAGPAAVAAPPRRRPMSGGRQQEQQQQPKGGLQGPELQLVEERLLELQFGLLSLHEQEAAAEAEVEGSEDGEVPVQAGKALMAECAAWFHPEHFAAVVEELASLGQCGYPPCRQALGEDRLALRPGQKLIDAKNRRIVDVTRETTMFCSDPCELAARRFAARLSTEAPIFRPVARGYVLSRKQAAAAAAATAEPQQQPLGLKGPSLVYDLVKRTHGAGSDGDAAASAPQAPQEEQGEEEKQEAKPERPPIRPKLRPRADKKPPLVPPRPPAAAAASVEEKEGSGAAGGKAPAAGGKGKASGGGGPLKMEVVERSAPEAPQPLSVWVAKGAEIEGHVVGVVARPSHQPVEELLAEVNNNSSNTRSEELGGLVLDEGGEEEIEEQETEEVQALPGDRITTEDELGWAPSTEIDLSAVPSVVDSDFFMQVWTTVSDWLTGESREYVRRVALGPGEPQEAVLAALLSRPEAKGRRALLDARKREVALGQVLAPHLPPATDAVRPLLADTAASSGVSPAMVTARVQGLLSTLDLARALPAFLSSKHYEALSLLFIDAAVTGGAGGAALQQQEEQEQEEQGVKAESLRRALRRVGLSPAEYRCVLGDFELLE